MIFNTIAFQDAAYHWARDHRVHHKYSETDADPHNATRGFFFSHIGWLLCKKHPEVKAKGKGVDLSDLKADPIIMFQKKWVLWQMIYSFFEAGTNFWVKIGLDQDIVLYAEVYTGAQFRVRSPLENLSNHRLAS